MAEDKPDTAVAETPGAGEEHEAADVTEALSEDEAVDALMPPEVEPEPETGTPAKDTAPPKEPETDGTLATDAEKPTPPEGTPAADELPPDGDTETPPPDTVPPETEGAFDAEAFAHQHGLDPDLIAGCKTEGEALLNVTRRQVSRKRMYDAADNELGLARRELAEVRGEIAAAAPPEKPAEAEAQESDAVKRYRELQVWYDKDRQAANDWLQEQHDADRIGTQRWLDTARSEIAAAERAERDEAIEKKIADAREAPARARLETEFHDFEQKYATDWDQTVEGLHIVAHALGVDPAKDGTHSLEDLRAMDQIRRDPKRSTQYEDAVRLVGRGLGISEALDYADAKAKRGTPRKPPTVTEEDLARTRPSTATPSSSTRRTAQGAEPASLDELPDEIFDA